VRFIWKKATVAVVVEIVNNNNNSKTYKLSGFCVNSNFWWWTLNIIPLNFFSLYFVSFITSETVSFINFSLINLLLYYSPSTRFGFQRTRRSQLLRTYVIISRTNIYFYVARRYSVKTWSLRIKIMWMFQFAILFAIRACRQSELKTHYDTTVFMLSTRATNLTAVAEPMPRRDCFADRQKHTVIRDKRSRNHVISNSIFHRKHGLMKASWAVFVRAPSLVFPRVISSW